MWLATFTLQLVYVSFLSRAKCHYLFYPPPHISRGKKPATNQPLLPCSLYYFVFSPFSTFRFNAWKANCDLSLAPKQCFALSDEIYA